MDEAHRLTQIERVYSFWGRFAGLYAAQDPVTFMGRPGHIRGEAVEALGLRKGDGVLEVGCGTGRNFGPLERAIGTEGRLVGFDYSAEMLAAAGRLCRRRGWGNVSLVQGDAAELDLDEEGFDGVLAVLAMSAIPDHRQALKRCFELLRPGGVLSVCDAQLFEGPLAVLNPLVRAIYTRWATWDPSKDLPSDMEDVFGNAEVAELNLGTFFIATAVKREEG
ncbi:MAG: class I SAM-dependent methyltransferase [Actinomycetia bacterium]|nr:class I SAM-dependent methyltransferase [Actinomycetes bacterium]